MSTPQGSTLQAVKSAPTYRMYHIVQRGKVVATIYGTYEEARQRVRARIRASVKANRSSRKGLWDAISRNPTSMTLYGYRITRA